MRFRFKFVAIFILLSLVFVFVYQLYWLRNSYNEQYHKMEQAITNAMTNADFKEIASRIIVIQTNESNVKIDSDGLAQVNSNMRYYQDKHFKPIDDSVTTTNPDVVIRITGKKQGESNIWSSASDMNLSIQKGLHRVIDSALPVNFTRFDSLLHSEFTQLDIDIPYFVDYIDVSNDSVIQRLPAKYQKADLSRYKKYSFTIGQDKEHAYNLYVENPGWHIFNNMLGLISVSCAMIVLLVISYIYLLRIILRQKTMDEIKSDFINNMTHELKTPISVTYAAIDAMQGFGLGDDAKTRDKYLTISKEQLVNLNSLVEQILTMSVEERKNLRLEPCDISVIELFNSIKAKFQLNAPKPILFEVHVQPADLVVRADKIHFQNIVSNLVENAIKYSGESVEIGLYAHQCKNKIIISISDTGIGIPSSAKDRIFDKFYRVSTGNVHNVKGYGLGLHYVKTIVDKHGWCIDVESTLGKGSCFKIIIT